MKILHLIFSMTVGGAETMLVDIMNEQINFVCVELIIVNDLINSDLLDQLDKRISIYKLKRKEGSKNPFPIVKLNGLVLKLAPNVIHCHNQNMINVLLPPFRKRTVLTIHNTGGIIDNLKKYAKIFSISNAVAIDIKNRSGLDSCVVMNGIHFDRIETMIGVKEKKSAFFNIVQVGRLETDIKGQHLLIEAISILNKKGFKNIIVDFIGVGKSDKYLKELVNKYDLSNQVNFLGLRDRIYIYKNLKNYNMLVQPSLSEGFGLTIVEAIGAKIPVLVSDINGPMEIIGDGTLGFFFKSGDSNELAAKILFLMKIDDDIKNVITEKAYLYAFGNFSIKKAAETYLQKYVL